MADVNRCRKCGYCHKEYGKRGKESGAQKYDACMCPPNWGAKISAALKCPLERIR